MREFFKWHFEGRRNLIRKMHDGQLNRQDMLVGFTRHTPAVVSHGPGGLNASIKGVGVVHKPEFLAETVQRIEEYLHKYPRPQPRTAARFLLDEIYQEEKVDPLRLSTIELARRHTYENLKRGGQATLLFYMPPEATYELRCKATCHHDGLEFRFVNGLHDVFHGRRKTWDNTPVYIFTIQEIYDNHPDLMGKKIYP